MLDRPFCGLCADDLLAFLPEQSLLLAQLQVGCCPRAPDAGSSLEEGPSCGKITEAKGKEETGEGEKEEEKATRGRRGLRLKLKAPTAPPAQAAPQAAPVVAEPLRLVSEALRARLPQGAPPSAVLTYAAGLVAALPTHVSRSSQFGLEAMGGNEARHAWEEARRAAAVEALWDGIEVAKKRREDPHEPPPCFPYPSARLPRPLSLPSLEPP